MGLPPVGKEYMCFQKDGKTSQAARCIKSRMMNKFIYSVLYVDTFEQQCVVLKCMLQSQHIKDCLHTIGIDKSLNNDALYEQKFLENLKNYKQAGKCNDQK